MIQFYKNRAHGIYLVYTIADDHGLTSAEEFLRSIHRWNAANFPLSVAGKKLDLADQLMRAISREAFLMNTTHSSSRLVLVTEEILMKHLWRLLGTQSKYTSWLQDARNPKLQSETVS